MSLYEKYTSKINMEHMYSIIRNILHERYKINIDTISGAKEYYDKKALDIFNNNNVDELTELNRLLLDHHITYFKNDVSKLDDKKDASNEFNKLVELRNKPYKELHNKEYEVEGMDKTNCERKLVFLNGGHSSEISKAQKKVPEKKEEVKMIPISCNSGTREVNEISSSRYNYKYNLKKHGHKSSNLKHISRVIIPYEDNHISAFPIIMTSIPELSHEIHLEKKTVVSNNHRKFGIYEPRETTGIICKNDVVDITISICDINKVWESRNDMIKVNVIELNENIIRFTCSSMNPGDFLVHDYIRIIEHHKHNISDIDITQPMKIKKIDKNVIYSRLQGHEKIMHLDDINMSIMNISNQSIIYFNK